MNIHAPQSYQAEAELRQIPTAAKNIITAQESKPIITITQDSLIAAYLMTRREFRLSRGQFSDICMKGERIDGSSLYNIERLRTIQRVLKQNGKKGEVFNGRGLISLILPDSLNYENKNNKHPEEPVVKIRQGVFIEGALDKLVLGSEHHSLIQIMNKEYGCDITANFIDNMQFLGNAWLLVHGFSVGLEDCMITSEDSIMAIKDTLAQCYTKAEGIEETTQNPGIREIRVSNALSQAKDIGMRIAKDAMRPDNNFLVTVYSGAKGDFFNIAQLTGLLGQQNLEGGRVAYSMSHGKRSLPHYPFGELSKEREYESRGFIRNSFIHGLTPEEFFFHAMSGREGVCDTAMGTAKSGYIQRRIVKICEDIKIQYDRTVRDVTGKIYQFAYGNDNYNPIKTIRVNGAPQVCNISRLASKLNTCFEEGISETKTEQIPQFDAEVFMPTFLEQLDEINKNIEALDLEGKEEEASEDEIEESIEEAEDDEEKPEEEDEKPEEEEEEIINEEESDDYEDGDEDDDPYSDDGADDVPDFDD